MMMVISCIGSPGCTVARGLVGRGAGTGSCPVLATSALQEQALPGQIRKYVADRLTSFRHYTPRYLEHIDKCPYRSSVALVVLHCHHARRRSGADTSDQQGPMVVVAAKMNASSTSAIATVRMSTIRLVLHDSAGTWSLYHHRQQLISSTKLVQPFLYCNHEMLNH